MILQNDIPFKKRRVKLLHDNVCEVLSDLGIVKAYDIDGTDIIAGLKDFLFLLKDLYSDTELFRTRNDREDYNALFAGVIFLNALCTHGKLCHQDGEYSIDIDKSALNLHYRKGNVSQKEDSWNGMGWHLVAKIWVSNANRWARQRIWS